MKRDRTLDLGKGAIQSPYDIRDYWYSIGGAGSFDWSKSFDIEKVVGTIPTKDQNGSSSCGGQAWAYYGAVLEAIATQTFEERSARWIYSHTRVPSGGSTGRANCDFVIKEGFALEEDATSYDNGKPPSESFMAVVPTLSKQANEVREISKALSYLQVQPNIETVATAIKENNGCILLIEGEDNGTWRSEYPKPPTVGAWRHWVYAGKVRKYRGKKQIGIKNSWGNKTGDKGWQWLGEEYFPHVIEVWTLAWDYRPALHKQLLVKLLGLYKDYLAKLTSK